MGLISRNKTLKESFLKKNKTEFIISNIISNKDTINDRRPEMEGIISAIIMNYREELLNLILVTGPPGMGKSYLCLRGSEEFRRRMKFKDIYGGIHFVRKKSELSKVFKEAHPGDNVILEEAGFLMNSKQAMSGGNVDLGNNLDIIRKKKLVVWANVPLQKSVDLHWRDMANFLIKMQRLDKKKEYSVAKCYRMEFNEHFNKSIPKFMKAEMTTPSGQIVRRKVRETWFGKPHNDSLITEYEKIKEGHMNMILDRNYARAIKREEKEHKEIYGVELDISKVKIKSPLLKRNERIVELRNSGLTLQEVGKAVGLSHPQVINILKKVTKVSSIKEIKQK